MTPFYGKVARKKGQNFLNSTPNDPLLVRNPTPNTHEKKAKIVRNPTPNAPCFRSSVGTYPSLSYSSAPGSRDLKRFPYRKSKRGKYLSIPDYTRNTPGNIFGLHVCILRDTFNMLNEKYK